MHSAAALRVPCRGAQTALKLGLQRYWHSGRSRNPEPQFARIPPLASFIPTFLPSSLNQFRSLGFRASKPPQSVFICEICGPSFPFRSLTSESRRALRGRCWRLVQGRGEPSRDENPSSEPSAPSAPSKNLFERIARTGPECPARSSARKFIRATDGAVVQSPVSTRFPESRAAIPLRKK